MGCPASEEGDTLMDTVAVARARDVVPVAAAWSDVIAGRALLAVASHRSIALTSFASIDAPEDDDEDKEEDGTVVAMIDIEDDNDDITCVAFSHPETAKLEDLVLAVGTAGGRVLIYRFGKGAAAPTLETALRPEDTVSAGGPTLVAAALFVSHTLVFVRGHRVVAVPIDQTANASTVDLGAPGTSLAHSPATHCVYAGATDGTVAVLALEPALARTGALCCRGPVRGVACSPSGALLFCHVQPPDRTPTAVAVYSLLPPPTPATPAPALLLDALARDSAGIDGVSLLLARCSQADLAAALAAPLLRDPSPLRHVVLARARALLFTDLTAPLTACATALALAHASRFLRAALERKTDAPLADIERQALAAHAAFLLAHDSKDEVALRIHSLVGDVPEVCPVCQAGLCF